MKSQSPINDSNVPDPQVHQIIASANRVAEILHSGFTEKIYENALALELVKQGLEVTQQANLPVHYEGQVVGHVVADLVVSGRIVVELKSTRWLDDLHVAQCANYLRATSYDVCLLINFGCTPPEVKKLNRHTA
jgi:GxxExxY protein